MSARMDMAKTKGCDGVEPDNIDAYTADNKGGGLKLTYKDQIMYNTWLAQEAHARDLSIGLKNDVDQINDLVTHFDWVLNEQCWEYNECHTLQLFIKGKIFYFQINHSKILIKPNEKCVELSLFFIANKAVFNCEYKTLRNCSKAVQSKISSIQGPLALNGKNMKMCNPQGQLVSF